MFLNYEDFHGFKELRSGFFEPFQIGNELIGDPMLPQDALKIFSPSDTTWELGKAVGALLLNEGDDNSVPKEKKQKRDGGNSSRGSSNASSPTSSSRSSRGSSSGQDPPLDPPSQGASSKRVEAGADKKKNSPDADVIADKDRDDRVQKRREKEASK